MFEEASEMLFAYPAAARAQFVARCQSDGPASAARALRADPSWAGPEVQGLDAAERSRLADAFARAGARVSTLRGLAAVGDEFA